MSFFKQFGGKVTAEWEAIYRKSPQWKNGQFRNIEDISLSTSLRKVPSMLYKQFRNRGERKPRIPIPIVPYDHDRFTGLGSETRMIWYGHSAILMNVGGTTIFIDPMLGPDTAPIAPGGSSRFSEDTLSIIDHLPEIDVVLITHDHYDHLDLKSILAIKSKVKKFIVALGVKRHLTAWEVNPELVTESDWWDEHIIDDIEITFTPTRHFSGRGLRDRMKALWGGWVIKSPSTSIWFSGDGGYGNHFKEVGKRKGPFDIGFMESGQYNDDWPDVHMFPHEAVQAAIDGGVRKAMPVHWGGFDLSYQHRWHDPAEEFIIAAEKNNLSYHLPALGEITTIDQECTDSWWTSYM